MDSKEQEYTRLIKEYKETIYTVCLMNSADQDEAKDMMQEALIRLGGRSEPSVARVTCVLGSTASA